MTPSLDDGDLSSDAASAAPGSLGSAPAETTAEPAPPGEMIARPARHFRLARYTMTFVLVVYGLWSYRDGFIAWPQEQRQAEELEKKGQHPEYKPHNPLSILINQILALALPPLGIYILWAALYESRGQYRLADGILEVPGHPPVPLDAIREIDKAKWDRKGIAYLTYELADSQTGRIKIDDDRYEQATTDAIIRQIEESMLASTEPDPSDEPQR